jgi:hypothetical protein
MAKLSAYHKISGLLIVLLSVSIFAGAQYALHIQPVDRNSIFIKDSLKLQTGFQNMQNCMSYVKKLPALLLKKGYPSSSVDSVRYDSTSAICILYVGEPIKHSVLNTDSIEPAVLEHAGLSKRNPPEYSRIEKGAGKDSQPYGEFRLSFCQRNS